MTRFLLCYGYLLELNTLSLDSCSRIQKMKERISLTTNKFKKTAVKICNYCDLLCSVLCIVSHIFISIHNTPKTNAIEMPSFVVDGHFEK